MLSWELNAYPSVSGEWLIYKWSVEINKKCDQQVDMDWINLFYHISKTKQIYCDLTSHHYVKAYCFTSTQYTHVWPEKCTTPNTWQLDSFWTPDQVSRGNITLEAPGCNHDSSWWKNWLEFTQCYSNSLHAEFFVCVYVISQSSACPGTVCK